MITFTVLTAYYLLIVFSPDLQQKAYNGFVWVSTR